MPLTSCAIDVASLAEAQTCDATVTCLQRYTPATARKKHPQPQGANLQNDIMSTPDAVFVILLLWVIYLPTVGWEDMFVALIPVALNHLASMCISFFHGGIVGHTNVLMNAKIKQRPTLASGLAENQLIKGVVVWKYDVLLHKKRHCA